MKALKRLTKRVTIVGEYIIGLPHYLDESLVLFLNYYFVKGLDKFISVLTKLIVTYLVFIKPLSDFGYYCAHVCSF